MRPTTTVAVIIAALLIFCTSSSLSAGEGASDACSLLSPARVSIVLGVAVGAGQPVVPNIPGLPSPTVSKVCGWSQPGSTTPSDKRVVLDIFGPMGSLSPTDRFNNGKTPVKGITKTPVSGIGDDAYYISTPGIGTGLNVKKGSFVFQIRVYGFSQDQIKTMEKTLAQDAVAKL